MAVVENQIACDNWLYTNFSKGSSTSYACPPKSVITDTYGLTVSGTYETNQLVKQSDISEPVNLLDIPIYVRLNWHSVPYNSRLIYYQSSWRFPQYFNMFNTYWSNDSHVMTSDGIEYDILIDTRFDFAGDTIFHNFDSSNNTREYCMTYLCPGFTKLLLPPNKRIQAIHIYDLLLHVYDSYYTRIGGSGSVTTNFYYRLSLEYKKNGMWTAVSPLYWKDQWNGTLTGSMVGYTERNTLDSGSSWGSSTTLYTHDLQGLAIVVDFYESGYSGGDSNSSW
jgi:hypothetical protein